MRLRQRTTKDGEVLAEDEHQPPVDHAVAGHDTITRNLLVRHAEIGAAVLDEHVPLFKGTLVEQHFDALARGELALGVLGVDALLPAALAGSGALALELFENLLHDELLG